VIFDTLSFEEHVAAIYSARDLQLYKINTRSALVQNKNCLQYYAEQLHRVEQESCTLL